MSYYYFKSIYGRAETYSSVGVATGPQDWDDTNPDSPFVGPPPYFFVVNTGIAHSGNLGGGMFQYRFALCGIDANERDLDSGVFSRFNPEAQTFMLRVPITDQDILPNQFHKLKSVSNTLFREYLDWIEIFTKGQWNIAIEADVIGKHGTTVGSIRNILLSFENSSEAVSFKMAKMSL